MKSDDTSMEIEAYVRTVHAVRNYTGMSLAECRNALATCDNDPLVACGYLHYAGCLVNLNGQDREAWTMRQARDYAKLLMLDENGSIAKAPPVSTMRYSPRVGP
ncbi:hypothetical protein [Stutzerimonas stutzeri]|uniref:hypothetical protein n=1 Tax=Stutzerimonas stutzeri TaxID=316 RepID=UPI00265D2E89|nr:hypothetical protein [Stutzerimonas stutzeri]MCF6783713.1 hypothetical protein [Stutzerimonas stutzeri]